MYEIRRVNDYRFKSSNIRINLILYEMRFNFGFYQFLVSLDKSFSL